jgi:hypothetical protein
MSKYKLRAGSVTGVLLLLFLGSVATANLFTPDKPFSEAENRVLDQHPTFSFDSLLAGRFIPAYEQYTSDQFALRDSWAVMKARANRALGKKDINGVYLGQDHILLESYTSPSHADLEKRVQALRVFHQATPNLRKYVLLAPTASSVLSDKLPAFAPVGDQLADLEQFYRMLPTGIYTVEVHSVLRDRREHEPSLYYKSDHHWTTHGAYYAYQELCRKMGTAPRDKAAFEVREVTDDFYGSLSSKSVYRGPEPDRIELYLPKEREQLQVTYVDEARTTSSLYEPEHLSRNDKYAIFLNGNHALVRVKTGIAAGKRLLIVKDSYANSLIPFMTRHYDEIDIVDLRYYDASLLQLVQERPYEELLLLYNAKTFFEDPSILHITEGI